MPRGRVAVNPFAEGSAESVEWETERLMKLAEREANPPVVTTERRITVTVSVEAINAAKALATLSGLAYREVLGTAAAAGVADLVVQVNRKLHPEESAMPF
jgi:hypothetical protein